MSQLLLKIITVLLRILTIAVFRSKKVNSRDINGTVSSTCEKFGLDEKYTRVALYTQDSRDSHRTSKQMFHGPIERPALRKINLNTTSSDPLPPNMFDIRKVIPEGKITNMFFSSTADIICIASKLSPGTYHERRRAS